MLSAFGFRGARHWRKNLVLCDAARLGSAAPVIGGKILCSATRKSVFLLYVKQNRLFVDIPLDSCYSILRYGEHKSRSSLQV